jgi:protein-tyrosine phosphatase
MIDIHAHILPNLDDGPSNMDESIDMCRIAVEDGIRVVVATPHMLKDIYPLSRRNVIDKVNELNAVLKEKRIDLKILPGAEGAVTPDFVERLVNGDVLTIGDRGTHVFVELIDYFPEEAIKEMMEEIIGEKVVPIISHPERNRTFQKNIKLLERFVEMGVLSQVTAMSITGDFGNDAQRCVTAMLKRGLTHFIASDAHSPSWRPPVLSEAVKRAARIVGEEKAITQVSGAGLNV